ncbi:hypothetical protein [Bradyrhizobium sp. SZCCHNR2032]|uniref:hypothetical protein n=1 Tax=Bradyrhizobium sp. SZCCHNR2032 TaxID=3057384 RepID=UPI002915F1CB|nr:hypothetical protein [Bradyrhizobium sp. SZCCHNR2032]
MSMSGWLAFARESAALHGELARTLLAVAIAVLLMIAAWSAQELILWRRSRARPSGPAILALICVGACAAILMLLAFVQGGGV